MLDWTIMYEHMNKIKIGNIWFLETISEIFSFSYKVRI